MTNNVNKIMEKNKLPLTENEENVFAYILGYIVDNGYSPTRREIADKFNFTVTGAQYFLRALVAKDRIKLLKRRGGNVWRNIVIVDRQDLGGSKK